MPVLSAHESYVSRRNSTRLVFALLGALCLGLAALGLALLCIAPEPVRLGGVLVAGPRARHHWTVATARLIGSEKGPWSFGPFVVYRDPANVPIY